MIKLIIKITGFILQIILPEKGLKLFLDSFNSEDFSQLYNPRLISNNPNTYRLFKYKDSKIEKLIHIAKYKDSRRSSEILAGLTYRGIINSIDSNIINTDLSKTIFIPIPSSEESIKEKGFNHLERIIKTIEIIDSGNNYKINFIHLLTRNNQKRKLKRQATLNKEERIKNTENIFEINSFVLKNIINIKSIKKIIIFDDVSTTGSTIKSAFIILQKYFPDKEIESVVIAF